MRQGMTLIELLVVVTVILVICGITYRTLSQAQERAHLATCISNLRQLIQAVHMYEQDWGTVPIEKYVKTKEGEWGYVQQMLFSYIHDTSIFICPAHKGNWFTDPIWQGKKWLSSYAYCVNTLTVQKYGRGDPKLKSCSPIFICGYHRQGIIIARYDGSIEIAPHGRYLIIRAEFERGPSVEEEVMKENETWK